VYEKGHTKKYQQTKTKYQTFEDEPTKVVYEPTQLLTVPIRKSLEEQKTTTKGPPPCTSRHITTNKSTIVSESQEKHGRYRQS
jgi:hypothetical protein